MQSSIEKYGRTDSRYRNKNSSHLRMVLSAVCPGHERGGVLTRYLRLPQKRTSCENVCTAIVFIIYEHSKNTHNVSRAIRNTIDVATHPGKSALRISTVPNSQSWLASFFLIEILPSIAHILPVVFNRRRAIFW